MEGRIKRVRLNLAISETLRESLDRLVQESGSTSVTEVIRHAVDLYALILKCQKLGGRIILVDEAGNRRDLYILS